MGAKSQAPGFSFTPFIDLKTRIERKGIRLSREPQKKTQTLITDEDLFLQAMKEVQEIREFRTLPVRKPKVFSPCVKGHREDEALQAIREIVDGRRPLHLPDTQEYVEWINEENRRFLVRSLHEGRFSVQDCLDLHGFIVSEAETAVGQFLRESVKKKFRCVKIIHGRGLRSPAGPVLKDAVAGWLKGRHRKQVIAFVTARQCDGGLGALYVLLK